MRYFLIYLGLSLSFCFGYICGALMQFNKRDELGPYGEKQ